MSEESEALMQEFRQAVYERLNSPQAAEASPREAIARRAEAYQAWLSSQPSEDEVAAVPTALVRHWVAADLSSWRSIDAKNTADAATTVYQNIFAYDTYAELLKELDQALYSEIISRLGGDEAFGNGFGRGNPDLDQETANQDPKIQISELLKEITYKERRDGSVLYSLHNKPIFIDHGQQILMVAEAKDDEMAILAGLYMAKQKFGGSIELTGSEEFKRRAIEVLIKHEVPVELNNPAQEAIRRELLGLPPIEAVPDKAAAQPEAPKPTEAAAGEKVRTASEETAASSEPSASVPTPVNAREGVIVDFGPAPYLFDKKQSKSFYVKLRNSDGEERVTWGVDLARVFRENEIGAGDTVTLNNLGRKQVTVEVPVRGSDGRVERYEEKTVHRNEWEAVLLAKADREQAAPVEPLPVESLTVAGRDARFVESIGLPTGDINDYPDLLPYRAEDHAMAVMWEHDNSPEGLQTIESCMAEAKYRAAFQAKLEGEVGKLNTHFRGQVEASEGYAIARELLADADKRYGPLPEPGSNEFDRMFQLENCWDPDEVIEAIEQIDAAYLASLKNQESINHSPSSTSDSVPPEVLESFTLESYSQYPYDQGTTPAARWELLNSEAAKHGYTAKIGLVPESERIDGVTYSIAYFDREGQPTGIHTELTGTGRHEKAPATFLNGQRIPQTMINDPAADTAVLAGAISEYEKSRTLDRAEEDALPADEVELGDVADAAVEHQHFQATEGVPFGESDLQRAENLVAVNAAVWWRDQTEAINTWSKSLEEMEHDLAALGPEPATDQYYWFDKTGRPVPAPVNEYDWIMAKSFIKDEPTPLTEIEGFGAGLQGSSSNSGVPGDISGATTSDSTTPQEVGMANADSNAEQKLILRGVTKLDNDQYDTTVLLYQGSGDYLQGYVKINGEKHQVLAFINERHPDPGTGEIKPNFITLSQPNNDGSDQKWTQIGFGNAVNRRGDGKAVYFDEVLFNVDNQILKAKVTKHVDADMHRKLGFLEQRKEREKSSASPKPEAPAQPTMAQPNPAQPTAKPRARA
ncbi:LPD7 domain-containing protein [Pseudomonas monteilii]|uniref:LPD7 domain-containing protein n=1 Tax=Pseudomonas monteilii TaxID=76759 RepID=UPI003CFF0331